MAKTNTIDFSDFADQATEAMQPVFKFNAFAAKTFERAARKQWEIAGAVADLGFAQLHKLSQPTSDFQAFAADTQSYIGKVGETLTKGSLELVEISREAQGEAMDFFTQQAKEVAEQTKEVASKAKKAA